MGKKRLRLFMEWKLKEDVEGRWKVKKRKVNGEE